LIDFKHHFSHFISYVRSLSVLKRLQLFLGIVFLSLILLYAIGRPVQLWRDSIYHGDRVPYLQMPSPTAMTLRWQTPSAEKGLVKYGISPEELNQIAIEHTSSEYHLVRLTSLKPATKYYYSIGTENGTHYSGSEYWFITPHLKQDLAPVKIAVLGDPGYASEHQIKVRDSLLNWLSANQKEHLDTKLNLLLTTGDNAYRSGTNKQFEKGFFKTYTQILRNTPVIPVYGNHDSRRRTFFDVFSFPSKGESGGLASGSRHYFSVDYNLVHIIIIDTEDSDLSENSDMLRWLSSDLAVNQQPWTIVLFHHPPYTKGGHDSDNPSDSGGRMMKVRQNIEPIIEKAGVDLVLSGHAHVYERSHLDCDLGALNQSVNLDQIPEQRDGKFVYRKTADNTKSKGTMYVVLGSSAKVSDTLGTHPKLPVALKQRGSLMLEIDKQSLTGYFITETAEVADSFTIEKSMSHTSNDPCNP